MKTLFYFFVIALFISVSNVYAQWAAQTLPGNINVTLGIDFINQNHGVTGGWYKDVSEQLRGKAYYTNNGGTNWIEASVPDSMRVMVNVQMINENIGYGSGAYNTSNPKAKVSTNQSQKNLNPALKKYYERIGMDFSGFEDYRGYFVETTDGGLSWHPKGTFEDSVYYLVGGMTFFDQQTGFVIANSPMSESQAILKTTDGGNNWYFVYPFGDHMWIEDINFIDNLNGIAVGEDINGPGTGVILRTTDAGESWNKTFINTLSSIYSITYLDIDNVLIGGRNSALVPSVLKSIDAGLSWQQFHSYNDDTYSFSGVDAIQNTGTILVYGTRIASNYIPFVDISLDGGISWNYLQLPQFPNYVFINSKMIDQARWYITGTIHPQAGGFVLFTDNTGGLPVELVSFSAESIESGIKLVWITATELNNLGFEVERRTDEDDWRTIGFVDGKGTTSENQNYYFIDDLFGVSGKKLFYRLKQIDFNGSFEYSNVVEAEVLGVKEFTLGQNYPNPFNPSTTINFSLAVDSKVSLKIFDILGQEVTTLINRQMSAGNQKVSFDASSLNSGVYFYRLQAGSFSQTIKMILVK